MKQPRNKGKFSNFELKDALKKDYPVRTFIDKRGVKHCRIYLPQVFDKRILRLKEKEKWMKYIIK